MHPFLAPHRRPEKLQHISIAAISIHELNFCKADEYPSSEDTIEMDQPLLVLAASDALPPEQFHSMLSGTTYGCTTI
jgi:hypothetical protein